MNIKRKPEWMKIKVQGSKNSSEVEHMLDDLHLNTVCSHANCPNKMECYERGTATFMILGSVCTRNCKFCDVTHGKPENVNKDEPKNLAKAVNRLKLKHAVITSVDRDDLEDGGATQFKNVIKEIRLLTPEVTVEVLIPDLKGKEELMDIIFDENPDVLNHNVEMVPELYKEIMPGSDFERSLKVLKRAKDKGLVTKTGLMVGLGETEKQMIETLKRIREVDCNMLTIGQYLQPSLEHTELKEYVTPEQFKKYENIAYELGFSRVAAGPFVRSSYKAEAIEL